MTTDIEQEKIVKKTDSKMDQEAYVEFEDRLNSREYEYKFKFHPSFNPRAMDGEEHLKRIEELNELDGKKHIHDLHLEEDSDFLIEYFVEYSSRRVKIK